MSLVESVHRVGARVTSLEHRLELARSGEAEGTSSASRPAASLRVNRLREAVEQEYGRTMSTLEKKIKQLEALSLIRLNAVTTDADGKELAERRRAIQQETSKDGVATDLIDPLLHQQRVACLLGASTTSIDSFRSHASYIDKELARYIGNSIVMSPLSATLKGKESLYDVANQQRSNLERLESLHTRIERMKAQYSSLVQIANLQLRSWDLRMQLVEKQLK